MTNSQAVIHKSSFDTEYVSYPINGMHSERDYHYQIYFLIFSHSVRAKIPKLLIRIFFSPAAISESIFSLRPTPIHIHKFVFFSNLVG